LTGQGGNAENRVIDTPVPAATDPNLDLPPGRAGFAPTQWSVVLAARSDSARRREALETLCGTYWLPIYSYLRRRGNAPADAEDLTQGFFTQLLTGDFLDQPDPARGRFRGFLMSALRQFLAGQAERQAAQKRGGGVQFLDWTTAEAERELANHGLIQQDPGEAYETSWALAVMAKALRRLEEEQLAAGKTRQFVVLKPYLSATPTRGDYEAAAQELGTSRTTVAVWVHRLGQRYAELVKLEIGATVDDPAEVKAELQHLVTVLRR
jgi:RNA polymerase sigma-70 factor (ECF subfamily)